MKSISRRFRVSGSLFTTALQLSVVAASLSATQSVLATTRTWLDTDGLFWNNAAGWTPAVVPLNGDDVLIGTHNSATSSPTLLFTSNLTGINLNSLKIDSTGVTGIMTLSQSLTSSVMNATTEIIGDTIAGNVYTQNGGVNNASAITLGNGTNGSGTYTLSGSAATSVNVMTLVIGNAGVGTMNQSGGTVNISGLNGFMAIGQTNALSASSYNLSNGTLAFANGSYFAIAGRGNFNQSGGNVTFAQGNGFYLGNGIINSVTNTYSLSNGSITGQGFESIGATLTSGGALFNQTGGNNTFNNSGQLNVGDSANGAYSLSTGNVTVPNEIIANANNTTGTFTQNSGTHNITNRLDMGVGLNTTATLNLFGGTLNFQTTDTTTGIISGIGEGGNATINQSAGILNAANNQMFLGYTANSNTGNGTYNLSGSGQLFVGNMIVGSLAGARGTMNQSGGTATFNSLTVSNSQGSQGTYNLSGGALAASLELMGGTAALPSTFLQTGGSNILTGGANLTVGTVSGNVAQYTMNTSTGSSILTATIENIGLSGNGTFLQVAGTNTVATLNIGVNPNSSGVYQINSGNLTVGSVGNPGIINIGTGGYSAFIQNGGNVTVAGGTVALPNGPSPTASLTIDAGSFSTAIFTIGASFGTNSLTLSAGSLTSTDTSSGFSTGQSGAETSTITINNAFGVPTLNAVFERLSFSGITIFNQFGGVNTVSNALLVGDGNGGNATYNLGFGSLIATAATIGLYCPGTFVQTGGSASFGVGGVVINGNGAAGFGGSYTLSNGSLTSPNSFGGFIINPGGTFTENAASGIPTQSGYVNNNGSFVYGGGVFNGTLENDITGTFTFSPSATPVSFIAGGGILNKGSITVSVNQSLGGASPGTLDNENALVLTGGSLTGSAAILNNGGISGFGTIAGTNGFTNNGSLIQGAGVLAITNPGNNINNGFITLAAGRQLQLVSANLNNSGSIALNGVIVNGGGTLVNGAAGTITGPGTISTPLQNAGTIVPTGTLNVTTAWTNGGIVQMTGASSSLIGATITNTSTINGIGTVAAPVNSSGTLEAIGGTLAFTGAVTNTGTLRTAAGSKLLISPAGSFATNAGLIDLAGGTFDNSNHTVNNTGTIAGYGVFSSAGLTNNANITFAGGTATVNGPVVNNTTIKVDHSPAIFTGPVTNAAGSLIKTFSTTVTFVSSFTNSGTFTPDPTTSVFQSTVISSGTMTGSATDTYIMFGGTFTNSGSFVSAGPLQSSDNTTNSGSFTQSGPQTWSNGTTFSNTGGTATFASDTGSSSTSPLNIVITAGTVNLSATQHLGAAHRHHRHRSDYRRHHENQQPHPRRHNQ